MLRRGFIFLLGGTAAAWPLPARAQQQMPVIGYLSPNSPESDGFRLTAFRQGLGETGYVEGQTVAIEYRGAEGQYDRLPALAADLVRRHVTVIVAATIPSAFAANAATSAIPIVFLVGIDPVSPTAAAYPASEHRERDRRSLRDPRRTRSPRTCRQHRPVFH
jgi:putative ABC transport system substrate-binding protein